jgi:hypothetical protein
MENTKTDLIKGVAGLDNGIEGVREGFKEINGKDVMADSKLV